MTSLNVANFVSAVNFITLCIAVFLALCGALTVLGKFTRLNFFRNALFLPALGIAALIALSAEASVFNISSYLRFFSGDSFRTTYISPDNPNVLLTTDGTLVEIIQNNDGSGGLHFSNLNRKVTSVHVITEFENTEMAQMTLWRQDQEGLRPFRKTIYKHFPYENHTPVYAAGNVEEMTLLLNAAGGGNTVSISEVAVNEPIPFFFSGLRVLAVSLIVFAIIVIFNKKLRAKASYGLFEYKFDPMNKKQNFAYAAMVILLLIYSWICLHTSVPPPPPHQLSMTNHLTESLIAGRTWLDHGEPEKMLSGGKKVYDRSWRAKHADTYPQQVVWMSDWSWYKGKHYTYYGVVPVALLYVPYKLITGNHLTDYKVIFWSFAVFIVFLAMLWRYCVRKFMPDTAFAFYMLAFLTLFFGGGFEYLLRMPGYVERPFAFAFAAIGILLLLKSVENEKLNRLKLFFACLCFALIVGCRPNLIFVSVLVPIVLWRRRSWKLVMFILIPYVMVAIPLCIYNYVRFESIFDFGASYALSTINGVEYGSVNIFGKLIRIYSTYIHYLLQINKYSIYFPYVETPQYVRWMTEPNILQVNNGVSGIINYPIAFSLLYLLKCAIKRNLPKTFYLPCGILSVAACIILVYPFMVGIQPQYTQDYMTFIVLASLFGAYYWSNNAKSELSHNMRLKVIYVLCAATIFVGACLLVLSQHSGIGPHIYRDPVLYRYLEISLGLVK